MKRLDLLSIADLGGDGIANILALAEQFAKVSERPNPKVPALRGKTVATLFFENSTRTRMSFETAAKRLSADTMTLTVATSSVQKGESLRDTVETLEAMGVDAYVIRHPSSGAAKRVAGWVEGSVVNAGDGQHEHPSQALLDAFTIREAFGFSGVDGFIGLRVAIVGDVRHSRVARSNIAALAALGAQVTLVAPKTLLPPDITEWPVSWTASLDDVIGSIDICYLLRLQFERMDERLFPSLDEYHVRFGLTAARAARLPESAFVLHPGPMVRGLEIDDAVASGPRSLVRRQVRNGVSVRMAILFSLLGGPAPDRFGDVPAFTSGAMIEERIDA